MARVSLRRRNRSVRNGIEGNRIERRSDFTAFSHYFPRFGAEPHKWSLRASSDTISDLLHFSPLTNFLRSALQVSRVFEECSKSVPSGECS